MRSRSRWRPIKLMVSSRRRRAWAYRTATSWSLPRTLLGGGGGIFRAAVAVWAAIYCLALWRDPCPHRRPVKGPIRDEARWFSADIAFFNRQIGGVSKLRSPDFAGAPEEIRTPDPRIRMLSLSDKTALVASLLARTLLSGISRGFHFGVSPVLPNECRSELMTTQRITKRAVDALKRTSTSRIRQTTQAGRRLNAHS